MANPPVAEGRGDAGRLDGRNPGGGDATPRRAGAADRAEFALPSVYEIEDRIVLTTLTRSGEHARVQISRQGAANLLRDLAPIVARGVK